MDLANPPAKYWHCLVRPKGKKSVSIVNDLTFDEIQKTVVTPWHEKRIFTVSGTLVDPAAGVEQIRIVQTQAPKQTYADQHNERMRRSNVADMATNRSSLPFGNGTDLTNALLFSGPSRGVVEPEVDVVVHVCRRLPKVAQIFANRSRKGRASFDLSDEYDVQDLLHGLLRGYLKYSVQEDPLPKVAGAKSSRADISVEELGVLIEIKYARSPSDQKRIFDEYSQDLVLYAKWPHLKTLIFLIYNSSDLRDPDEFIKLGGMQEIAGRRFNVEIVLA
jgi:hypothetical protein